MKYPFSFFHKQQDERSSNVAKNIFLSVFLKLISIITNLLLIPITIDYVSSESYGIWLTLTSIIGWASFFDVGFGNGLRNRLAESVATNNIGKGRKYISTTYFCVFSIFFCFSILSLIVIQFIDWNTVLNVSIHLPWVKIISVIILMFSMQMVLYLLNTILTALQHNALGTLLITIGQVLALFGILLLTKCSEPNLFYLALCLMGVPNIVYVLGTVYFFTFGKCRPLRPTIKLIDLSLAKDILKLGSKFFILQICAILLYQTSNIIIMRICGPSDVTSYNIVFKFFSIVTMGSSIILSPLWSAYTDAYSKGDYKWMNSIYNKLCKMFLISILFSILLLIISPFIYNIWIGHSVQIPYTMSIVMMIYVILQVWHAIHSTLLNGIGKIKLSMLLTYFTIIFCIPLSIFLCRELGASGVVLSTFIVNLPGAFIVRVQIKKILSRRDNGIWSK